MFRGWGWMERDKKELGRTRVCLGLAFLCGCEREEDERERYHIFPQNICMRESERPAVCVRVCAGGRA